MAVTYTCDRCGATFDPVPVIFRLGNFEAVIHPTLAEPMLDPSCQALIASTGTTTTSITQASLAVKGAVIA